MQGKFIKALKSVVVDSATTFSSIFTKFAKKIRKDTLWHCKEFCQVFFMEDIYNLLSQIVTICICSLLVPSPNSWLMSKNVGSQTGSSR